MNATTIAAAGRQVAAYFADLPPDSINQLVPRYATRCCVGAHLAHILGVNAGDNLDYLRGADAWAQAVGGNRAHAILLLRAAGAARDPFSGQRWPTAPAEVFRRVVAVETLPVTVGADLSRCILTGSDLHGTDLAGAKLARASLLESNLRAAILSGADLTGANLVDADLTDADLNGADLTGAHLDNAKLAHADLTDAVLEGVTVFGTTLQDTILTGASFAHADLTGAHLEGADLTETDLGGTDLTHAQLDGATLPPEYLPEPE